jgi:hypothetical protein
MKKSILILSLSLLILIAGGCRHGIKSQEPLKVAVEQVKIADYGRSLFSLDPMNVGEGLDSLSVPFRFFIGEKPDTLKVIQIRDFIVDPFNRELADKCLEKYPDLTFLGNGLTETFGYIKGAYPAFRIPAVYTYISGLLYEYPVSYLDSVLIIGLDMFLGWNEEQYRKAGLPVYMTRRMEQRNIIPECARQVAFSMIPTESDPKTLLEFMVLHGKILYAMDLFLPDTPDSLKIGYTSSQMKWSNENESSVWRLFIDQEMLYKSDAFLINRFIQDGPFTSGLPEGSPAMLGRYTGWQIVKSYMQKHPSTDLITLFSLEDAQMILSKSGFKPKK